MSVSPQSGTKEFERLPCLKYDNILKQENRLTLGLNTVQNIDYYKKNIEVKGVENSIFCKKLSGHMCLSHPRVELGARKIAIFKIL